MKKLALWNFTSLVQEYSSKITSINSIKMPKSIKKIETTLEVNQVWADIGGGRFNNVKEHFATFGVKLFIYDPYNRQREENEEAIKHISNHQCDGVMVNNVLNVIKEKENRQKVISQAKNTLKEGAKAYFLIYEGNSSGIATTHQRKEESAYQLNQKAHYYLPEILEIFGKNAQYHISNGMICVTNKLTLDEKKDLGKSIDLTTLDGLIAQSKKSSIPQRDREYGVGKIMGHDLYIHKDYENLLPKKELQTVKKFLAQVEPNFEYTIVKYNKKTKAVSFIHSPDFDTSDEPIVGKSIRITQEGEIKVMKQKADPQIYHHKWNFVSNDYTGFNIRQSIERSISWKKVIGTNKDISSRIGTQSFWKKLAL
jgi:hypothetical protein